LEHRLGRRLLTFGQLVQHIGGLVHPAPLLPGGGEAAQYMKPVSPEDKLLVEWVRAYLDIANPKSWCCHCHEANTTTAPAGEIVEAILRRHQANRARSLASGGQVRDNTANRVYPRDCTLHIF
jgi:hypothetical protein